MDITDVMIHVHPQLSVEQRAQLEEAVSSHNGVISVHFSPDHPQELTVAYNPEVIDSKAILELVRQWDQDAVMVGL